MSDIEAFITKENVKLDNLVSGLSFRQRAILYPKIVEIRYLLNLLKSPDLTRQQKQEIKDDVEAATDEATDESKAEQLREASNFSITRKILPTTDTIPMDTRENALMAKASSFYSENNGDKTLTDEYLKDNNIPFSVDDELSTSEGLVLKGNGRPDQIRVAYRGSKINNLGDWISNAQVAVGSEDKAFLGFDRFNDTYKQIDNIKTKYDVLPELLTGHSRGATLAMTAGNRYGIDTETFNPFLGQSLLHTQTSSANHKLWRTTEDLPSLAAGFKQQTDNYTINSVRPLEKNTGVLNSHRLDNFTDAGKRSTEDIHHSLAQNVSKTAAKQMESLQLLQIKDYLEDRPIGQYAMPDSMAVKEKIDAKGVLNDDHYDVDKMKALRKRTDEALARLRSGLDEMGAPRLPTQADLDRAYDELEPLDFEPDPTFVEGTDPLLHRYMGDINNIRYGPSHSRIQDQLLTDLGVTRQQRTEEDIMRGFDGIEEPDIDPDEIPPDLLEFEEPTEEKTFIDFLRKFDPNEVSPDGKLTTNRIHQGSKHYKLWKAAGGKVTDEEEAMMSEHASDRDAFPLQLKESEVKELAASEPEERQGLFDEFHQDNLDAIKAMDKHVSLPNEQGGRTSVYDGIRGGLNPMAVGIGLIAGQSANTLIDKLDPDKKIPEEGRQALGGALGSIAGETAISTLGGTALTLAGTGAAGVAGAGGSLAAYETYKGLKEEGASDFTATVGSGAAGGFTSGALLSAATAGGLLGAEAAAPLDLETAGLASLAAGGVGASIGAGAYALTQGKQYLDKKFSDAGFGETGTEVASDALLGSAVGTAILPGIGTVAGAAAGSLYGLASEAFSKIF